MPEISVIVPVYNAEKYLTRCIEHILLQQFTDFELLVINDGSTDSSYEIVKSFAERDSRVKIINQNNAGVSAARNQGIKEATGRFITFCDSDDFVSAEWLIELYHAIMIHPNSLVDCEYVNFNSGQNKSVVIKLGKIEKSTLISKKNYFFYYTNLYSHSTCHRIYRLDVIKMHQIFFDRDVSICEDVLFNIMYLKYCDSFFHIAKPLYFVDYDNNNSLTRKPRISDFDILKATYFPRLSIVSQKDKQDFIDEYFYRFYQCLCKIPNYGTKSWQVKYGNHILRDEAFIHALNYSSDYVCGKKLKAILNLKNYRFYLAFMFLVNLKKRLKIIEIFTRFTKRDINE